MDHTPPPIPPAPQPPPFPPQPQPQAAPAMPPPMPPQAPRTSGAQIAMILGGITIGLILLFCMSMPFMIKSSQKAKRIEAINNIKQISLMLIEFETEYGKFPDASTIAPVKAKTATTLTLGDASSNQLFRQFFAEGLAGAERPFWVASAISNKKPDQVFVPPSRALEKGECAFGYVAGLDTNADPETPVVFAPLLPGTNRFDHRAFDGMAVILRADSSVTLMAISKPDGVVKAGNGMDIFDPRQPYWKGKAPAIKLPE